MALPDKCIACGVKTEDLFNRKASCRAQDFLGREIPANCVAVSFEFVSEALRRSQGKMLNNLFVESDEDE